MATLSDGRPGEDTTLIRGGRVIDAASGTDRVSDVLLEGGRIAQVGDVDAAGARQIDATGHLVLPGLVDTHVHLSTRDGGRAGHAMLARAGVTTALDLGGPPQDVLAVAGRHGAGLTIGCLASPEASEDLGTSPSVAEALRYVDDVRSRGALGVKLHVEGKPTPALARAVMEASATRRSWLAIHCGTVETRSDIEGMRETMRLLDGSPAQIAHVNSYCRGEIDDPVAEANEAVALLRAAPNVFAESYLAVHNGNWAGCRDGLPSERVRAWIEAAGYPGTQDGLRTAILEGWASVPIEEDGVIALATGQRGVDHWEREGTQTGLSLPLNPFASRVLLADSRDAQGAFDVDALATDGGGIPRNVTLEAGAALIELGSLTWRDLVEKACWAPARALGLAGKGRVAAGADADVAIVDPATGAARVTIADGLVVQERGRVTGAGTRALIPASGAARRAAEEAGCVAVPHETGDAGLFAGPPTA